MPGLYIIPWVLNLIRETAVKPYAEVYGTMHYRYYDNVHRLRYGEAIELTAIVREQLHEI